MAKAKVIPIAPKGQAKVYLHTAKTLERHPIAIAISKAEAARWLLAEIEAELVGEEPAEETLGWVRDMALRELAEALVTAKHAFYKAAELHRSVL
jgi:hypothetical protein